MSETEEKKEAERKEDDERTWEECQADGFEAMKDGVKFVGKGLLLAGQTTLKLSKKAYRKIKEARENGG